VRTGKLHRVLCVVWFAVVALLAVSVFGSTRSASSKDAGFALAFWVCMGIAYRISLSSSVPFLSQLKWVAVAGVFGALVAFAQDDVATTVDGLDGISTYYKKSGSDQAFKRAFSAFARIAIGGLVGVVVASKVKGVEK
jgi:hypothetical protein